MPAGLGGLSVPTNESAPISLRIGVTGHRSLRDSELVRNNINRVLDWLEVAMVGVPYKLIVVSPLAEGTDRLVAHAVLARRPFDGEGKAQLEAILPLPVADYRQDFETPESQAEFGALLERANVVQTDAAPSRDRAAAYAWAGEATVRACDVLIAVWDGKPSRGQGGTGDIVAHARRLGRWMFWIHAETGEIVEENRPTLIGGLDDAPPRESAESLIGVCRRTDAQATAAKWVLSG